MVRQRNFCGKFFNFTKAWVIIIYSNEWMKVPVGARPHLPPITLISWGISMWTERQGHLAGHSRDSKEVIRWNWGVIHMTSLDNLVWWFQSNFGVVGTFLDYYFSAEGRVELDEIFQKFHSSRIPDMIIASAPVDPTRHYFKKKKCNIIIFSTKKWIFDGIGAKVTLKATINYHFQWKMSFQLPHGGGTWSEKKKVFTSYFDLHSNFQCELWERLEEK